MQSSDNMTAPTRANQGAFSNGLPEKRGIRFNPHVTVQGDPAAQWDISNGMKKLSLDDGGAAKDHARAASSDSSADSAPIVTPVPGKEANDIHVGPTKKPPTSSFTPGAHFQVAGGPASQTRPANLPPGYPYRGPNAPVTLGGRDEILQVDYNLQPRHFIPSSIASSPAASVHSQPQARATGANATSPPAAGTAPFTPGLSMTNPTAFYGQPSAYNGAAGAPGAPSVDPAAANEVAQRIINNALQQAALITGNAAGVPLNPALAATYTNPQFMAGLYNPTMYGQAPSANPYYSAGPGMPDPAMAAALANAVATLPPAAFHAALQGFAGYGVPGATNPANPSTVGGPSANNRKLGLYKSELCRSWSETGSCRYGPKCQFAHGEDELRKVARHPKYKTEICRTFWVSGSCPYGKRCCFIHTEVPGGAGGKDGEAPTPTAATAEGRARSHSTNSDPDQQTSMLTRIKRQEPSSGATGSSTPPTSATGPATPGSATFARPSPAALRVDTSSLDSPNHTKESYPYTSNAAIPAPGMPILRTDLSGGRRSPAPATAGPDFGRHNTAARLEVVGNNPMPQTRTGPGHLRSVSQTFQPTDQSSGRASPVVVNGHLRSDSWSAASALVAPSSAIDPPARYRESKW